MAGRKLTALALLTAAVAAGALLFRFLPARPSGLSTPAAAFAFPNENKSLAVFPFANLSEDKSNDYFVSGMRDEILTGLGELRALNVRSRTPTRKYQDHPKDLATVSRELGVENVLEGTVQKAGDDVLIGVQLIDARNGHQLWSQSYRRNVKDVFSVQGEVEQQVADA